MTGRCEPDQDDLINASRIAVERGDAEMVRYFQSVEEDHDEEPCPAVDTPCAGYRVARDYLLGRVPFGGVAS